MDPRCTPGNEKDVIALLLEEYRPLRAEISSKLSGQSALLAFAVAGLGVILTLGKSTAIAIFILAALLLSGLAYYLTNMWIAAMLAAQVHHLEERINALAKVAYGTREDLLSWESRWEGHSGSWESINPLFKLFFRRAMRQVGSRPS